MLPCFALAAVLALDPTSDPAAVSEPTPEPEAFEIRAAEPEPEPIAVEPAPAAVEPSPAVAPAPAPAATTVSVGAQAELQAGAGAGEPAPEQEPKKQKKPKPSPAERLAHIDQKRVEMHLGIRGYGRHLGGPSAIGASAQLGMGVRLVRGLYIVGELGAGAHGLPFGVQAQGLVGLHHELRLTKWVRPSWSLGYTFLVDTSFDAACGCTRPWYEGVDFEAGTEIVGRNGAQAGLGLRFPMPFAPRLSAYLEADGAYYFDDRPGRLQIGGGVGIQVVF
ncbi:MAG: hypothetical protein KC431_13505 [Myxococcales bacterium]|nr:hypothetical protein [Myxococcales bacterium]